MRDAAGAVKLPITVKGLRGKMKELVKAPGRACGERDCGLTGRWNAVPLEERTVE